MSKYSRRNFIKISTFSATGLMFGGALLSKLDAYGGIANNDRIVVILRLNGGNDGLATVIPQDQYANLVIQRKNSNILHPEQSLLNLGVNNLAFPSFMAGLKSVFDNRQLSIIQNVAMEGANRSHFRNTEKWMSGIKDEAHPQSSTGWLGRTFNKEWTDFPSNYPNTAYPDPFGISMGFGASKTCEGDLANFAHPVVNPSDVVNYTGGSITANGTMNADLQLYLKTLSRQTDAWNIRVSSAADKGESKSKLYDEDDKIAVAFQKIAKMISGGLATRVYTVDVNGFDTHSSQVETGDPLTGRHPELWTKISKALTAFQDDLNKLGLEKRVLTMTFSEFGRQIASNASNGTDHGEAAPMLVMGECVTNQVIGTNPIISNIIESQKSVPMEIDVRDVYATILKDWYGVSETAIENNFEYYGGITYQPFISSCNAILPSDLPKYFSKIDLYPNPCNDKITVKGIFPKGNTLIKIQDVAGRDIKSIQEYVDEDKEVTFRLENLDFPAGNYILSVYTNNVFYNKRGKFVKT